MNDIVLIGGGGHCRSCIDVIEQAGSYSVAGIVDLPEKLGHQVLGYEIFATENQLDELVRKGHHFLIAMGQIKDPAPRKLLFKQINALGGVLPTIVSPLAHVSPHAQLGRGVIVMHHALVNAGAVVGDNSIVNSKALVEHDAVIGKHCHIATGGVINGGVVVEDETFWGSGAVSREYIVIGKGSVIGCGVSVKKNMEPGSMVS
ncbi:MAG: NeuD/PglB/VioB family sugar acetyltransferase [Desulfobulbaceae bacterium]|nr:NeuD/PglB/VioB family sugar acetyltransferase [Desulfobulbaceae bacterium]